MNTFIYGKPTDWYSNGLINSICAAEQMVYTTVNIKCFLKIKHSCAIGCQMCRQL